MQIHVYVSWNNMMTSSNGTIFRVTGPFLGESTGHWWIPLTNASDAKLWCFLLSAPEQTVESTNIRDAGDLRRHRAHYDVTVMKFSMSRVDNGAPVLGVILHMAYVPQVSVFETGLQYLQVLQ